MFGARLSGRAAFAPVAGPGTRLLILGSLPGEASLRAGQYYAHPQNAFWRLIGAAIGREIAALPYPERLAALAAAGVGLWDVVASAERPGSGDAAIRDPEHADLAGLVARLPALRAVGFNGGTAARLGRAAARRRAQRPRARRPAVVEPGLRGDALRREARALGAARRLPRAASPMLDPRRRRPTLRRMDLHRRSVILALLAAPLARAAFAASPAGRPGCFPSIDGGTLDLADFRGGPVLVVNTASRCGSTPQYDGLQALWERYRDRGLTVVGVPSKSFGQELDSAAAVKDFCEVNFAIDFPMTGLVAVTGPDAHPFYALGRRGRARRRPGTSTRCCSTATAASSPASTAPPSPTIPTLVAAIEALLRRLTRDGAPTACRRRE